MKGLILVIILILYVCCIHCLTLREANNARIVAERNLHLYERPIIKDIPSSPKVRVNWDGHVFVAPNGPMKSSSLHSTFADLFKEKNSVSTLRNQ